MTGQKSLLDFWTPKRKRDDSAEPKQKRSAKKAKTQQAPSSSAVKGKEKADSSRKSTPYDIQAPTKFTGKQDDTPTNRDSRPARSSPRKNAIASGSQVTPTPSTPRKTPLIKSGTYPSMPRTRKAPTRAPTIIPETPEHIRDPPTPHSGHDFQQSSPTRSRKLPLRSFSSLPSSLDLEEDFIPSSQSQYIIFPPLTHRDSDSSTKTDYQLDSDEVIGTSQSQENDVDYAEYWKNRSPAKPKQTPRRNSSTSPTFKRPIDPVGPWDSQDDLSATLEGHTTIIPEQQISFTQQTAATESDLDFEEWAEESRRERLKELNLLVSPRKQYASAKAVGDSQSSLGTIPDAVNDFFNDLGEGSYPPDFPESLR